uniref:(northern house mosquito) hypothetical protein n=1 Tax=Culex pipiens TaxID=7175 RepID=A0A8D8HN54_CULPI
MTNKNFFEPDVLKPGKAVLCSNAAAVEEIITARKQFLHARNTTKQKFYMQPTVMAVGPDDCPTFMVVFDNIKYRFRNVVEAIGAVIAITFVLNLNYNADAVPAWSFVQEHLFEIASKKKCPVVEEAARILMPWKDV